MLLDEDQLLNGFLMDAGRRYIVAQIFGGVQVGYSWYRGVVYFECLSAYRFQGTPVSEFRVREALTWV